MPSVIVLERPQEGDRYYDRFRGASVEELIEAFNREVGSTAWVRARAEYLAALYDALLSTGLDCSSFISGEEMSLDHKIRLEGRKLATAE